MATNVFYEEDGNFKVGHILVDNGTTFQVESLHGKRSKIKANAILLTFARPDPGQMLEAAQALVGELDADFLWEVSPQETEFSFQELAQEYVGGQPDPATAAAMLMKLHASPMHFYKKGRGRYKAAPPEALIAAKASEARRRQQAELITHYAEELAAGRLPEAVAAKLKSLLYAPDKQSLEYKALERASDLLERPIVRVVAHAGGLPSTHDYHLNRFLFEHFPQGRDFGPLPAFEALEIHLLTAEVSAFSIDDASTTEIDDAFSVTRVEGGYRIGVHIAAPGLLPPDTPWEEVARSRQSTVYIPGDKITMLPEDVIAGFSLDAGSARPALSLYLMVNEAFEIQGSETVAEFVPVAANLRIEELEPFFNADTLNQEGPDYPFREELHILWHFAQSLEAGRGQVEKHQYLDFNFHIEADRVQITQRRRGSPIDKVVSELMIQTNAQWGRLLAQTSTPGIYRTQRGGKVKMSTVAGPHQGLGVEYYIWSTSPLRRYVDLINQRELIALAQGFEPPYRHAGETLMMIMREFELAYDSYNNFQRHMERYWCLRYLEQEGMLETEAVLIKENLARLDGLPLVLKVQNLPDLAPGVRIRIGVSNIDLIEVEAGARYLATVPAAGETGTA